MDINHNKVVYIHKGEHDDPHGLPQQQYLEGSTEIEHTLYSHTATSLTKVDSFKKLEYIYQHFQNSKKIYESDPDTIMQDPDNTLYPHTNNDIEYGLFEDVINSYYLDSQIKDDFNCNQECYTDIQQTQQEQQLTPCTHAYDHITQHINNLDDNTQQNTLYTMEEDSSLFTSDTATPCDHNITKVVPNSDTISKGKSNLQHQWELICKVNINTEMSLAILTYNITNLIMVMHSLSKTNTQHYYKRNHKILTGAYMIPSQLKVIRYLQKWTLRQSRHYRGSYQN